MAKPLEIDGCLISNDNPTTLIEVYDRVLKLSRLATDAGCSEDIVNTLDIMANALIDAGYMNGQACKPHRIIRRAKNEPMKPQTERT